MSTFFHNKIISTAMKSIHETVHSSVPFHINIKYQCRIINAAVGACDPGQQYWPMTKPKKVNRKMFIFILQIKCCNLSEHSYLYLLMFNCMEQNDNLTQLFHQCFLFGKLLKQYISNMAPNNSCILSIYGLIRPCNRLLSQVAVTFEKHKLGLP